MSECDVDFEYASEDADPVQCYTARTTKGRKVHVCVDCREAIPPGVPHQRITYKFEGDWADDRRCASCIEAAKEFKYSMAGGGLWEEFMMTWDQGSPLQACLNRLHTASAKAHMQRQWLKWQAQRLAFARQRRERLKKK